MVSRSGEKSKLEETPVSPEASSGQPAFSGAGEVIELERVERGEAAVILKKKLERDKLVLELVYYPLWKQGYGNKVVSVIEVEGDVVSIYKYRINWNGTGTDFSDTIKLTKKLLKKINSVKNIEEFRKLFDELTL